MYIITANDTKAFRGDDSGAGETEEIETSHRDVSTSRELLQHFFL